MKIIACLLCLLFAVNLCSAQQNKSAKFDEYSIVKNEDGEIFSYGITQKLLQTSAYGLKRIPNSEGKIEFLLYRYTKEQQEANEKRRLATISTMAKPRPAESFKEGEKISFDKMKDINGVKYDLKNNRSKVVVLNFWFINCPPCKREIPELNDLVAKYKNNEDILFIAIALDDATDLKKFLQTMPFSYNIVDDGRFYATKYGVNAYPTHVVIDKDNVIKFSTIGLASNTIYWIDKTIADAL